MSDAKTPPGGNGHSGFQPRWRLDLDDDGTITFDRTTQTITKIKTGESCCLGDYPVVRRRRTAVPAGQQQPRTADREVVRHRGGVTISDHLPRRFHTRQSAFGSGIPSLVENRASSWVDSPTETTDRSKNTSVRYANDTAQRLTERGMAYRWYMRVTNFAA